MQKYYSCDKNANGTIYVYDKSMDSVPIGSIKITPPTANAGWGDYVTKTIDLYEPLKEGKHTIYLKFVNDISGNVVNLKDFTLKNDNSRPDSAGKTNSSA